MSTYHHSGLDQFQVALSVLRSAVDNCAFPGSACAVQHHGVITQFATGAYTFEDSATPVTPATIYDLASLTKPIATTAMAMLLYDQHRLDLDAPVISILSEFRGRDARRECITLRMLLAHTSGLPAHVPFFKQTTKRDELVALALSTPLEHNPGSFVVYSDIGFMVLGLVLERLSRESLDSFCERNIFQPIGMTNTSFCPSEELKSGIAPTVADREFRDRVIQGEVHDENAWVMGGVAGHAGLFSTAADVSRFARCLLDRGAPLFRPETVNLFTTRQSSPARSSRALGWDTRASTSQCGEYFSARTFGHLGYTGTSLWIDPEFDLAVTLLTNRTWPDCRSQVIKKVRPQLHNAIVKAIAGRA